LLSLDNEAGAKSVILQNPERVARLAFPEGATDIDTWQDWEKLNDGVISIGAKNLGLPD
jgi:hypothetical protein